MKTYKKNKFVDIGGYIININNIIYIAKEKNRTHTFGGGYPSSPKQYNFTVWFKGKSSLNLSESSYDILLNKLNSPEQE